jgi:hypothetical protein
MRFPLVLLALLTLPLALAAADPKPASSPTPKVEQVAWLAGQWRSEKAGRVIDEQWMTPGAGLMLGMARTIAKGKVIEFEFVQIREGPGGDLFYVAKPSGQAEAAFRMKSMEPTAIVFENTEHDFPQVIGYLLQPDGGLLAFVEGPKSDGTTKRIEYSYRRVAP